MAGQGRLYFGKVRGTNTALAGNSVENVTVYTVPASKRALITGIRYSTKGSSSGVHMQFYVLKSGGTDSPTTLTAYVDITTNAEPSNDAVPLDVAKTPATPAGTTLTKSIALEAGDKLKIRIVNNTGGNINATTYGVNAIVYGVEQSDTATTVTRLASGVFFGANASLATSNSESVTLYTVPASKYAVIRDLFYVWRSNNANILMQLYVLKSGGTDAGTTSVNDIDDATNDMGDTISLSSAQASTAGGVNSATAPAYMILSAGDIIKVRLMNSTGATQNMTTRGLVIHISGDVGTA